MVITPIGRGGTARDMTRDLCIDRLVRRAATQPAGTAYLVKRAGGWQPHSWGEYMNAVREFGAGLIALGHRPRQVVAMLGFNRPEWVIGCVAAQCIDGVGTGIYTTCSPEEVHYVLEHCEAFAIVLENGERWRTQLAPVIERLPKLERVVLMEPDETVRDERVMSFAEVCERGRTAGFEEFETRFAAVQPEALATLIYTSGTTGPPKGVMLSHRNIAWTVQAATELMAVGPEDALVSYLPLAHIAEQMFTIYGPMATGAQIYYAESLEKLADNLREVQPTTFFGVPRIYEKMHAGLQARLERLGGLKAQLLAWARRVAFRVWELRHRTLPLGPWLELQYLVARRLVLDRIKEQLGFGRARMCVTGAAPIPRSLIEFFMSIDVPIYEVYGQSEDSGPTSFNRPGAVKLGTVGQPIPGVEVRIAEDGEILVRGPNVFMGYYKDEAATAETLREGWLHSGDIGELDAEGYLRITDRKKDIIITSGGKNISPQLIENMLKQQPLISQAVVIGDRRNYLVALLALDPQALAAWAAEHGLGALEPAALRQHQAVRAAVQQAVDEVNRRLAKVEQIKRFAILERELSIEGGELTPTMKVKRRVVERNYAELIESLYQQAPAAAVASAPTPENASRPER
ncbi:MAG: AMP-dependent synthetase [Planctomycetota bacterium]|nr:MAG: AMP-dependent synthetase [Planctomycetota bacterium]